jgi:hypothetical protein
MRKQEQIEFTASDFADNSAYEQELAERKAAEVAAAHRSMHHARQCSCGAVGAIMLHKQAISWTARGSERLQAHVAEHTLPACGPCAVALMEQGWTPEPSNPDNRRRCPGCNVIVSDTVSGARGCKACEVQR